MACRGVRSPTGSPIDGSSLPIAYHNSGHRGISFEQGVRLAMYLQFMTRKGGNRSFTRQRRRGEVLTSSDSFAY